MLRVFVFILVLLLAGACNAKENYGRNGGETGRANKQEQYPHLPTFGAIGLPITIPEEEKSDALWDSKECPQAKSHDEADLCEQRRMSEAADKSVSLNIIQVCLGIAGFLALLITIRLTSVSTKAAVDAAKAATSAWEEQRRPYVFVSGVATLGYETSKIDKESLADFPEREFLGNVTYTVKNHGAVPAIVEEARAQFIIRRGSQQIPLPDTIWETNPLFIDPILSPDESRGPIKENSFHSRVVTPDEDGLPGEIVGVSVFDDRGDDCVEVTPIMGKGCWLVFRVVIYYRGPFTSGHETSACWIYDPMLQRFDKTGAQENYER